MNTKRINSKRIALIGFIMLLVIVSLWTSHMKPQLGNSAAITAFNREGLILKYSLWVAMVVIGTAGFIYFNMDKDSSKNKLPVAKPTELNNSKSEIEYLKSRIAELEKKQTQ